MHMLSRDIVANDFLFLWWVNKGQRIAPFISINCRDVI